jgi:hypothetical protein
MSDNNWPDPARPGVPMNPDRDGWHWVNGTPREWVVFDDGGSWRLAGSDYRPHEWAHRIYQGPCLTPTEVESHKHAAVIAYANLLNLPAPPNLIAQARRDALEEAARIVEAVKTWNGHDEYCESCKGGAVYPDSTEIAAAIRALKGEGG